MSKFLRFFEEIQKNIEECYDKDPKYTISMKIAENINGYITYEKYTAYLKTFEANVYYDIFLNGKTRPIYITTLDDQNNIKDAIIDTIDFYTRNTGKRSI